MNKKTVLLHVFCCRRCEAGKVLGLLALLLFLGAGSAMAATAILPIRANLIQCGTQQELPKRCAEDERCCALLEKSPVTDTGKTPAVRRESMRRTQAPGLNQEPEKMVFE